LGALIAAGRVVSLGAHFGVHLVQSKSLGRRRATDTPPGGALRAEGPLRNQRKTEGTYVMGEVSYPLLRLDILLMSGLGLTAVLPWLLRTSLRKRLAIFAAMMFCLFAAATR